MPKATFRFHEELNRFLPEHQRKVDFQAEFIGNKTVKEAIETLGIPHSEIDLILVNGKSVNFDYILREVDRVSVFAVFGFQQSFFKVGCKGCCRFSAGADSLTFVT